MAKRTVRLRDVAEVANVSASAASMALRDHPRIGDEAKARVRAAAEQLGYVPNSAGRALRARQAEAVAVIVPNTGAHVFGHSYFMHVLTGVSTVAGAADMQVVISTSADEVDGRVAYDRVLRSGRVDGAILTSAAMHDHNVARILDAGVPVVLLGRFPYLPHAVSVGIDDRAAERRATEHLILVHGRRELVHLSGPLDHQAGVDRRDGFAEACATHGVRGTVIEGDFGEESGNDAGRTILDSDAEVEGVVAANDEMALGVMRALRASGRAVPQDVSIIGFDDFGLSRVTSPSISTIHVPAERMAHLATERLLDLVAGASVPDADAHMVLEVDLVARESCGCSSTT